MKIKKQTAIWTTKAGTKIRVCDMSDAHIVNTMRLIDRRVHSMKINLPYPDFQGEMAQMCAEQEWQHAMDADTEDICPIYYNMKQELERRGALHLLERLK